MARTAGRRARAAGAGQRSDSPKRLALTADEGYARRFLAGLLTDDAALAERFARGMGAPPPAGMDCGRRVAGAFREAAAVNASSQDGHRDAYVDLEDVMRTAGEFEASGDLAEASRIYGQIADAIAGSEGLAYLGGDHHEAGPRAVEKWAECLGGSGPAPSRRRAAIGRAFRAFKGGGMFSGAYGRAMTALCASDADLEHLLGLVRPHARPPPAPRAGRRRGPGPGRGVGPAAMILSRALRAGLGEAGPERRRGGGGSRMLAVAVDVLDRLGRASDANRLVAGHARARPSACALLAKRLAGAGSKRAAAGAAAEGLDRFGADPEIIDAALSIYGRGDPPRPRCAVLIDLFMRTGDESYYDRLRRLPGWERERPRFIRAVAGNAKFRRFFLAHILVREGMHKRAIGEISASGDPDLFASYRAELSAAQPRAYLAAYGRSVRSLGERASTGEQYARVSRHLGNMSRVRAGGREAAGRVAAALARKHPGRRKLAAALAPFLR